MYGVWTLTIGAIIGSLEFPKSEVYSIVSCNTLYRRNKIGLLEACNRN